jgi:hypothetical protein
MTDTTPRARDDTAAVAAYAAANHLTAGEAAADWRFITEREREHWRGVADAAVMAASLRPTAEDHSHAPEILSATPVPPVGPGQAAWLKSVELWGPGHAATWDDLSEDERRHWALIANAGIGGSEYVRGLEAIATPAEPKPAPEAPGYRQACAALAVAVDALQRAKFCTDDKLTAMARETLAEIGRLTYDAASLDADLSAAREGAGCKCYRGPSAHEHDSDEEGDCLVCGCGRYEAPEPKENES